MQKRNMAGTLPSRVFGKSNDVLVIDACLASCGAEWWHIAEELSGDMKVVTYDRAGYGGSPYQALPRTPANIAHELHEFLGMQGISSNIILLGHSQGGLYAVQYALMYPGQVKGLVLLDPATPFDNEFKNRLTAREYTMSGVDKTSGYQLGLLLSSLGVAPLFKPLLKKSPPFYYHQFSRDAEEYLLGSLTRRSTYRTALEEYRHSHMKESISGIVKAVEDHELGDLPVRLITHSSGFYISELEKYAGMAHGTAEKVETIWQEIMKRYLNLSSDSKHTAAQKSGHYIHLTEPELARQAVFSLKGL